MTMMRTDFFSQSSDEDQSNNDSSENDTLGPAWLWIIQINSSIDDKLKRHENPFGEICVNPINS